MQIAELMELLVLLGHEADATKLQAALDSHVKAFIKVAEGEHALPVPPPRATADAVAAAERTAQDLQRRLHDVRTAVWKWELLRPM